MIKKRYWHVKNKWKRHLSLLGNQRIERHLPPTRLLNRHTLRRFLKKYETVYIKPVYGSFGNRIIKITRTKHSFLIHKENRIEKVSPNKIVGEIFKHTRNGQYHIQKGIRLLHVNGRPVDFRVLVLKPGNMWEFMGIMGKVATGNRIVTNFNHGGRPIRFARSLKTKGWSTKEIGEMQEKMRKLSLGVAERFSRSHKHCRRLGIDMGIDQDKNIWVIEVNTNPFYELFAYHEKKSLYGKINRYMKRIQMKQSSKW